ncbi:hypothetical protein B0H16DRAFT_1790163 [Mycena metata]|uniref:Uncharacterized protein n=1 Tax=Mycena metata TaxID=1033252 RepID=A0AAD7HJ47_9AGAR|nr:hypothetical protein B0H16DRAFT_1790163 [Mycena metata]
MVLRAMKPWLQTATPGIAVVAEAVVVRTHTAMSSMVYKAVVLMARSVLGPQINRDANGNPACSSSGGGGGGGSPPTMTTTTHKTTTTTAGTTAIHTTGTSATTAADSAGTTVPSAPFGSQNVVIDVSSSTEITWTGEWLVVSSSCTPGTKAKAVTGNTTSTSDQSMAYTFTGTCIYLSVASSNAQYMVTIDGEDTNYGLNVDSPPTPSNCTFGWSRTDLSATGEHFLEISIFGPVENARRDSGDPWTLEIQNLAITQPESSASGSSVTASAKAGDGGDSNVSVASANIPCVPFVLYLLGAVLLFV